MSQEAPSAVEAVGALEGLDALEALGWDPGYASTFAEYATRGLEPARVVAEHRGAFVVRTAIGELDATVSGRFRHDADAAAEYPAVGDWAAIAARRAEGAATIHALLPRRSAVTRDAGDDGRRGGLDDQVLAANVEVAIVVAPIDRSINQRRLERYVALAWSSGAEPVIVLSKADLAPDTVSAMAEVQAIAPGVDVLVTSVFEGVGMAAVDARIGVGRTAVVLGPSGAGKTTLINGLLGTAVLATGPIRDSDGRGRHTTTHRQLLALPSGALLIDTPGLRSIGLVEASEGLRAVFEDVEALVAECRFPDCGHDVEPGCAVRSALEEDRLDRGRFDAWRKLQREEAYAARERDPRLRLAERRKWKKISASVGRHMNAKYGEGWR